ncbi:hypothetical protein P8C59_001379 [Phyllachora maydis]|uniref:Ribokinase n=2 Tax=Phyllachora maydis TaxID=1825666 RepID=A0AAD9M7S4_9PEZI|nr:hypothetical protein P8C59_001379 [Phyllachora maydis]
MSSLPRITVLGSLNIDLVAYVPHHPQPGETLTSTSFSVSPGGKGANQAIACAKLSRSRHHAIAIVTATPPATATLTSTSHAPPTAHVAMVGCVGADSYGTLLCSNLEAHGVDVSRVDASRTTAAQPPQPLKTGIAMILVDQPTGENRIVLSPEANHAFRPEEFETSSPFNAATAADDDDLLLRQRLGDPLPDLLVLQLEIRLDAVLAALRAAKRARIAVLLNPAPAVALPDEALAGLACLVLNETEAAVLAGCGVAELSGEEALAGLERVAGGLVTRGVEMVIVTLGARGAFYMVAGGRRGLVPGERAQVVDTTAAGDTFVGRIALEVAGRVRGGKRLTDAQDFDVEAAVRRANRAAAKTVERMGAQGSIPWRDELDEEDA